MSPSAAVSRDRRPASILTLILALACTLLPAPSRGDTPDTGWPRTIETSRGHTITIYEPRVASFKGNALSGDAAAAIQPPGDGEPTFGALWFTSTVKMDSDAKAVTIDEVDVTQVKFPENTPQLEETVAAIVERELPRSSRPWPLERIYAGLQAEQKERAAAGTLRSEAPAILTSTTPAVLVVFQGEPQARPVSDSELSRIVNTAHFVVYDNGGKNYYLSHGPYWYQAREPMGPWEVIGNPPSNVLALKPEESGAERDAAPRVDSPPSVIASSRPAELIVFEGKPRFTPVGGDTDLLYVTNSDKDVLKDVESQQYFVLLSGRWFSSSTLNGPWSFVPSDKLPEDFANIPRGSEVGHVRTSVAGTPEAEEALLSARVPRIEAVEREVASLEVTYDGTPRFKRIKGTDIEYAVNTSSSVFRCDGEYYACEDAVWYVSDRPDGPWTVTDRRPEGLEALPAENPHYHTKYVYIYDSNPDVVYVGYTPGYFGCYPYWGSVVYGTGWYYSPWIGHAYYPYPVTWGFGVSYWGGWGFGFYGSWGYGYYGYPGYAYGYYPAYCGSYGPGGYWPVYTNNTYATTRTRGTVTDREWSGYPSTKSTAYRKSATTATKSTAPSAKSTSPSTRSGAYRTGTRSGTDRYRSAEESLTRRSSGSRERGTLSDRGMRSMRGTASRDRVMRGGESYRRGDRSGMGVRSRGDVYGRPQTGRGSGDRRAIMRGDGRSSRDGGRSWSSGRSGWGSGRSSMGSGSWGGGRSGGGVRSGGGGGGGGRGGSYGGARRR